MSALTGGSYPSGTTPTPPANYPLEWPPDPANYPTGTGGGGGYLGNQVLNVNSFAAYANRTTEEWTDAIYVQQESAQAVGAYWFGERWRRIFAAQRAADYSNAEQGAAGKAIQDLFEGNDGPLEPPKWENTFSGTGAGELVEDQYGGASWDASGGLDRIQLCRWDGLPTQATSTDAQEVAFVIAALPANQGFTGNRSGLKLLAHVEELATDSYCFVNFYRTPFVTLSGFSIEVGYFNSGDASETVVYDVTDTELYEGDVIRFMMGTSSDADAFTLTQNGVEVQAGTLTGSTSGAGNRAVGFGVDVDYSILFLSQLDPGSIAAFWADDSGL